MKKYFWLAAVLPALAAGPAWAQTTYTLPQSKQMALQNNARTRNGALEIKAAEAQQRQARVKYFPDVSALGAAVYSPKDLVNITTPALSTPITGGPGTVDIASFRYSDIKTIGVASVTALQPIYAGGQIRSGNKLAALQTAATRDQLVVAQQEVALTTEQKYYQIVALNEKLTTLAVNDKLLAGIYKQVNDTYKAGLAVHNDVMKVQLQRNQLELSRVQLHNGRQLAIRDFCQYVGVPYDSTLTLADARLAVLPPQGLYKAPAEAAKTRPEYQLLQRNVDAEALQTQQGQGKYLPQVAVGASAYANKFGSSDATGGGLFLGTVSVPISGRWEAKYLREQRTVREQIALNDQQNNTQLLELQVTQRWLDLLEAYKRTQVQTAAVDQTQENLKVNHDTYTNGLSTLNDLLEAQAQVQQAQDNLTEARTQYQVRRTAYLLATGQGE